MRHRSKSPARNAGLGVVSNETPESTRPFNFSHIVVLDKAQSYCGLLTCSFITLTAQSAKQRDLHSTRWNRIVKGKSASWEIWAAKIMMKRELRYFMGSRVLRWNKIRKILSIGS
jgi:hypothetical protein